MLSEVKKRPRPPKGESVNGELAIGEPTKCEYASPARFRKYFPADYSSKQVEDVIVSLLKE